MVRKEARLAARPGARGLRPVAEPIRVRPQDAAAFLVGQAGLSAPKHHGPDGIRAALAERRCIQLDPLDRIGTNADLVVLARVDGVRRGDVYTHLAGHAFEHFAKERCLLPASSFPHYRDQCGAEPPWWWLRKRLDRFPPDILDDVLREVRERGPIPAQKLRDRGTVEALDWSGWRGTPKATTMAIEVLWTECRVVVSGRSTSGARLYDVPDRAFPAHARAAAIGEFDRWALLERVEAAGFLSLATGPHWSMLSDVRTSGLPERLVREGAVEEVTIDGSPRRYLAPRGWRDRTFPEHDGQLRILGPLDPVLWDRKLVSHVFGFDYVWEVYKPQKMRKWGWYVVPLLHEGRLVGRVEAHRDRDDIVVDRLWKEVEPFPERAWKQALARHAAAM